MLGRHPDLILDWLKLYLDAPNKVARSQELEEYLKTLVKDMPASEQARYYFELAELRRSKDVRGHDYYYRKCVRLGFAKVVDDVRFHAVSYEVDFLMWFDDVIASGKSPAEAEKLCLEKLWRSSVDPMTFVKSRQHALEKNWHDPNCRAKARADSIRLAESGCDWAERWIFENVEDGELRILIPDALLKRWIERPGEDERLMSAVGAVLADGRPGGWTGDLRAQTCLARHWLDAEDLIAALGSLLDVRDTDIAAKIRFGDVIDVLRSARYEKLARDLESALRNGFRNVMLKEFSGAACQGFHLPREFAETVGNPIRNVDGTGFTWNSGVKCSWFLDKPLKHADERALSAYYKTGVLPQIALRCDGDEPLCSRAILMEKLSRVFDICSVTLSGPDAKTVLNQIQTFSEAAERELLDAIKGYDLLSALVWIIRRLPPEHPCHASGIAALVSLALAFTPEKLRAPMFLMARSWFVSGEKDSSKVLFARLVLGNPRDFDDWLKVADERELLMRTFDELRRG